MGREAGIGHPAHDCIIVGLAGCVKGGRAAVIYLPLTQLAGFRY